jgi:SAM-dependent methyltransferase
VTSAHDRPDPAWFADEAFWETLYPFLFSDAAREAARADVGAITSLIGRQPATVLDLACGPGRHSVPFAKQGGRVTGVDRSPFLLGRAREYAAAEGADVRWVQADMREFAEPASFELAVSLFTSFGYFEAPADNRRVLANVHASLVPGGVFVMDIVGKEILARIYQPCRVQELPDGALFVQRAAVIDDWTRVANDWLLVRNGQARSFRFRHWIYSAAELRELLRAAGFADIDVFGGLDASPYGVDANRLVLRARRPA